MSSHDRDNSDRSKRTPEMDWGWSSPSVDQPIRTLSAEEVCADNFELMQAWAKYNKHPVITGLQRQPGESDTDLRHRVKQAMFGLMYGGTGSYTRGQPVRHRQPNMQQIPHTPTRNGPVTPKPMAMPTTSLFDGIDAQHDPTRLANIKRKPFSYDEFKQELIDRVGAVGLSPAMEATAQAMYTQAVEHTEAMEKQYQELQLYSPQQFNNSYLGTPVPPEEYRHPDDPQDPLIRARDKWRATAYELGLSSTPPQATASSAQALKEFKDIHEPTTEAMKLVMKYRTQGHKKPEAQAVSDPPQGIKNPKRTAAEKRIQAMKRAIEEGTDW